MTEPKKMDLKSMSITEDQKAKLKQLFPEVFAENKIDFDKLKLTLGEEVDTGDERYGMTWPGKNECFRVIQEPSVGTLRPCKAESVDWDTTQNLFIEGDNLEVLKLLQKAYYSKVKMIYIDPPYNTGKEFIYPDKYSENLDTYLSYTGQADSEGRKFSTNSEADGRFHSKWLNMMLPRLFLAKNLLRDDGVIFISIDDHEVKNLRELCDEVFGEESFIGQLIWKRRVSSAMSDNNVSADQDYVICYHNGAMKEFAGVGKDFKKYSNPDNDPRGPWISDNLTVGMTASMRPNQAYDLIDPATGIVYPFNPNRVWAFIPESMNNMISEGRIIFPSDPSKRPMQKRFQKELKSSRNPFSTLMLDSVGLNTESTRTIQELMGGNVFDYSKPVSLLQTLVPQVCNGNDIVVDFFAGSCVTAHAVLELNKQDGGNRKFIMVQLPEPCNEATEAYKAGYKTIADIGKERIRRVIKKLNEEDVGKLDLDGDKKQDRGFRVYKLDRSSFRLWDGSTEGGGKIEKQIEMAIDHIDSSRSDGDILYELLLKAGFELTTPVKEIPIADKAVYSVADNALLVCLDRELTKEVIAGMAKLQPARVICLDAGFAGNDQLKTNAVQIMKSHGVEDFRTV